MLKAIDVKCLFGLYSYFLDFTNPELKLKFITGPNGYGKTTLLSFINSLYLCQFDIFKKVPFDSITYLFEKETIEIIQERVNDDSENEDSDESHQIEMKLIVRFYRNEHPEGVEVFELKKDDNEDKIGHNLGIYLSSLSCYYIKDQRLRHKQAVVEGNAARPADIVSILAVKDNADDLCNLLAEQSTKLNNALNVAKLQFGTSIDEVEYNKRKQQLLPVLEQLQKFGLADESLIPKDYVGANVLFLTAYLVALEKAVNEIIPFVQRLETFFDIIDRSHFADKRMEIHPRYGYRFKMNNELENILPPFVLSSGEQHILILSYELLFKAKETDIVLIDEPEMSFHLMWQMDFLKNLSSIIKLRNIQCIISTHSPQIFSQNWKLTVDLYKLSKSRETYE